MILTVFSLFFVIREFLTASKMFNCSSLLPLLKAGLSKIKICLAPTWLFFRHMHLFWDPACLTLGYVLNSQGYHNTKRNKAMTNTHPNVCGYQTHCVIELNEGRLFSPKKDKFWHMLQYGQTLKTFYEGRY